jgi:hypothetical protein
MIKRLSILALFICFCIVPYSFKEPEYSFTEEDLSMIDSLYRYSLDSLERKAQAMCDSIRTKDYDKMVDSLKEVRKKEIFSIIAQ